MACVYWGGGGGVCSCRLLDYCKIAAHFKFEEKIKKHKTGVLNRLCIWKHSYKWLSAFFFTTNS